MVILNATIVVVALPDIQRDLGFAAGNLSWVVNTYLLTFGGFLLLVGRLADIHGRKRIFLAGVLVFTMASAVAGVAASPAVLLVARAIQGLGAAAILPTALSMIVVTFPDGEARRRALSRWGAMGSIAGSVAYLAGGLLTSLLSWTAVFLSNVPIGLIVVLLAIRGMRESRAGDVRGMDVGGALAVTGGSAAVVYVVSSGQQNGWFEPPTMIALAAAVCLLTVFVAVERRRRSPLIRLDIFRSRRFTLGAVTISVLEGAMMTVSFLMTLYFQRTLALSPFQTGLAFLPITAMLSVAALTTYLLLRKAAMRLVLPTGLFLIGVGAVGLTFLGTSPEWLAAALAAMTVIGAGVGVAGSSMVILATAETTPGDAGTASGVIAASREIVGGVWLAVLTSIAAVHGRATALSFVAALVTATAVLSFAVLGKDRDQ